MSTIPTPTVFKLPTFYELGFTRDEDNPVELCFLVQRGGLGTLNMRGLLLAQGVQITTYEPPKEPRA